MTEADIAVLKVQIDAIREDLDEMKTTIDSLKSGLIKWLVIVVISSNLLTGADIKQTVSRATQTALNVETETFLNHEDSHTGATNLNDKGDHSLK